MAGTLPTTPIPETMQINSYSPSFVTVSHSFRRITRTQGVHRWLVDFSWGNRTREELAELHAFFLSQKGRFDSFFVSLYGHESPRGTFDSGSDSPVVNGADQVGDTLNIAGLRLSETNILRAGDYFTIAGSNKVYMVREDSDSDGSGEIALPIFPNLVESPSVGAALTFENVVMEVALTDDSLSLPIVPPLLYSLNVQLIENPS